MFFHKKYFAHENSKNIYKSIDQETENEPEGDILYSARTVLDIIERFRQVKNFVRRTIRHIWGIQPNLTKELANISKL